MKPPLRISGRKMSFMDWATAYIGVPMVLAVIWFVVEVYNAST